MYVDISNYVVENRADDFRRFKHDLLNIIKHLFENILCLKFLH